MNKLSDLNTLKVLFGIFNLHIKNREIKSFSIKEIVDETKLEETQINTALNNIDAIFDKEEFNKTGIERYKLSHFDQVPLLITMLIPSLDKYNFQIN